jgi:hypothetical protein
MRRPDKNEEKAYAARAFPSVSAHPHPQKLMRFLSVTARHKIFSAFFSITYP